MDRKTKLKAFRKTFFGRGVIAYIAVAIIALLFFVAIFAPILTPYNPNQIDLMSSLA